VVAVVFAVVVAVLFALPANAPASPGVESIMQDDNNLIYTSPGHEMQTLRQMASLGVDRVKVSVVWWLIAPRPNSRRRPRFNAANPAAYPGFGRYDELVIAAHELGLKVYFSLGPPSPAWAIPRGEQRKQGPPLGNAPDPGQFRQFVRAVGRRYSGHYTPGGSGYPLPRVSYWGVWNESNERSWLNPMYAGRTYIQAALYRSFVDAAWSGLGASGHRGDTFLIGETANRGILAPLPYLRAVYCVNSSYHVLRGGAASRVACPTSGNRSRFVAAHPGLFHATGYAHHPYGFDVAPDRRYPDRSYVTLSNISALERAVNAALGAYGKRPGGGEPLYLTEWGYKTNPPNPYVRTSLTQQAAWLDQGEYMTWKIPFIRALANFLLVDDKPKPHSRPGSKLYWSTWQTGLEFRNGTHKPSWDAYRIPIWLPSQVHGSDVTVWGQLKPANHTSTQSAELQFQPAGSSSWNTLTTITTTDSEGFVMAHVSIPSAGQVRLAWTDPGSGSVDYSRNVPVS
jgi:hypothetical protein